MAIKALLTSVLYSLTTGPHNASIAGNRLDCLRSTKHYEAQFLIDTPLKLKSLICWRPYIFHAIFDSLFNLLPENVRLEKPHRTPPSGDKQTDGIQPAPACNA